MNKTFVIVAAALGLLILAGCGEPTGEVLDVSNDPPVTAQSLDDHQGSKKAPTPTLGIGEED
jgi:hypothetical protein